MNTGTSRFFVGFAGSSAAGAGIFALAALNSVGEQPHARLNALENASTSP